MINIVDGDLIYAKEDILVHQVNCQWQGVMNSGVAKDIRNNFTEAYEEYKKFSSSTKDNQSLLGEVQLVNSRGKIIANMFSQLNYGYDKKQYTNYLALATGLNKILKFASQKGLTIAIPYKIGCVRGGADWNVVLKIIENIFMDYDITIYKLNKF